MGKKVAKKRMLKELKVPDKKKYSKNKKVKVKSNFVKGIINVLTKLLSLPN